jgi:assimilatory nitrate reductase catalytic subunit
VDERIEACIFISERPALPSYGWLSGLFQKPRLSETERGCVLSAGPPGEGSGAGATVCACLSISRSTIEAAIAQGCHDVRAIGAKLRAGTQCGSCVPEVKRMIRAATGGVP